MTATISLAEASERLGVHYMTAYRYVRTGRLHATKQGGQWQVNEDDLAAFVDREETTKAPRNERLPAQVTERLLAGDENGTFQILEAAMASGADIEEVYLEVMAPAMVEIGQRWHDDQITIADEHLATSTAYRIISRLGSRIGVRGRTRGTIILATVSDDFHALPTAILRDLLKARGFNVVDLGANTPPESIVERAQNTDELIAIGVSSSTPGNDDIVEVTLTTLNESLDVPIVVGGGSFRDAEHIESLGKCKASTSTPNALDIFDKIHASQAA